MKNVGESVLAKLKNLSRETGMDMLSYIRLYAQQRLLYRISVSDVAGDFCLKGGVMLAAYNDGALFRSSEDIDFHGFADGSLEDIEDAIKSAIAVDIEDDGVRFDITNMRSVKEHIGNIKGGKISLTAYVHTARVPLRVDVGFKNIITPEAKPMEIPTLLPDVVPCPVIAGYPLETIIAEKLHAIRQFGLDNTRHKDLYDLWCIQKQYTLDGSLTANAIARTFERHGSIVESNLPGLSEEFVEKSGSAWPAFMKKNGIKNSDDFSDIVSDLRDFSDPLLDAAADKIRLGSWNPDKGWEKYSLTMTF